MAAPFMRAYTKRLVQICHRHNAHAIGGMAAFVPNRRDPEVTERAFASVRDDKEREAADGFDGTWVAHPDLVPVAREVFDRVLGARPHQKEAIDLELRVAASDLLNVKVEGAAVTIAGVRTNVDVALQYLEAWLRGGGAVAIHDLMEDAATAEISRSQLWQWIRHATPVDGSGPMTAAVYRGVRDTVVADLQAGLGEGSRLADAVQLLDELVLGDWQDFLTTTASKRLED
jgi:malate synthase